MADENSANKFIKAVAKWDNGSSLNLISTTDLWKKKNEDLILTATIDDKIKTEEAQRIKLEREEALYRIESGSSIA